MCLSPITIPNKKYRLDLMHNPQMWLTVSCGKCSECRKRKANDYMARSYAQYKDTLERLGFSYFDTLTYNNACVPHFKGMLCFNSAHIRNFLKRLRITIERYFLRDMSKPKDPKTNDYPPLLDENGKRIYPYKGKVKGNLKYYVASEYGGKTHRPHYHVIFFVTIPNIDVLTFRDFVASAWHYGFIDRRYTVRNRVINGIGACKYISEYVNKDYEFQKELTGKLAELSKSGVSVNKHVLRRLKCFHRQSVGYGLGIITQNKREILEQGLCEVPDKKYVHKLISLPMYIKRKLFQVCVPNDYAEYDNVYKYEKTGFRHVVRKDLVRKSHWEYTEYGKEWKMNRHNETVQRLVDTYERTFANYYLWLGNNVIKGENADDVYKFLCDFRENVGCHTLATYCLAYRGRCLSHDCDIYEQLIDDMEMQCDIGNVVYHEFDMLYKKVYFPAEKWQEKYYPFFSLDNIGVYKAVPFCNYDTVPVYVNDTFELVLSYLHIIQGFHNEVQDKTYFAKCEYRAKKKLLESN